MATLTTWIQVTSERKKTCLILDDPAPECFCRTLNSLDVSQAVPFCMRDFKQCPNYKRYMGISEDRYDEGCPVLEDPEPDCYCLTLNSYNVPNIICFCIKDFKHCPIHMRCMKIPKPWNRIRPVIATTHFNTKYKESKPYDLIGSILFS